MPDRRSGAALGADGAGALGAEGSGGDVSESGDDAAGPGKGAGGGVPSGWGLPGDVGAGGVAAARANSVEGAPLDGADAAGVGAPVRVTSPGATAVVSMGSRRAGEPDPVLNGAGRCSGVGAAAPFGALGLLGVLWVLGLRRAVEAAPRRSGSGALHAGQRPEVVETIERHRVHWTTRVP